MTLLKKLALLPAGNRSKWVVLVLWLLLAGAAGPLGAKLIGAQSNDITAWLPKNAESTKALQIGRDRFGIGDTLPATVVYSRPAGITDQDTAKAEQDRAAFARFGGALPPLAVADDHRAVLLTVPLTLQGDDGFTKLVDNVKTIRHDAHAAAPAGLDVQVTGPAGAAADQAAVYGGVDGTLLLATVAVVAILLILTYRSPLLWLLPLISVGISASLANAVVYLLVQHAGLVVNGQSTSVLTVLVFGAGTDYALLLIARYREELRRQADRHEAMRIALRRSLPAVVASATTVTLGLLCLLAAQMNSTRGLGPVAAVGIVVALVSITTLLPALLVILGRWLFWPFVPRPVWTGAAEPESGLWGRIGSGVARRPRPIWLVSALALAACAIGALGLHTGLSQNDVFTDKPESVTGQAVLAAHYPAGSAAPLDIYAGAAQADRVTASVQGLPGVASLSAVQTSGDWMHVQVLLTDTPTSKAAEATVGRIRTAVHDRADAGALIGGSTAQSLDVADTTTHDERLVMPLVLAVVLLVLMVLLRALVAPVLLLASVVLSFGAALGASVLLFRALGHPRSDESLPLMGFLFLVALGVDYTIFMMTRAREEAGRIGHAAGVVRALGVTGGVITSAGLVLAATFSVLGVLPAVSMLQLGVLVAVGVLLDTLVVRTLLVPALSLDVGPRLWWPSSPTAGRIPGSRAGAEARAGAAAEPDSVR
ncbi:MMPL family transporter [Kitasatospora aureofaciens]|uniref:MMPL family transporter n=1 Tax=Kitasatospora aureofaciens TaxID=1894 RepID=UPI001C479587|nr:MMPL family transporter [Kitasatospora aureofaciens]MBV6696703.1 MMPL family transporter [Kitasatospora aureofaciens]